jgi:hypothetical protein
MRAFRRRAAAWRQRVRRAAFAAMLAATVSGSVGVAQAQIGSMGQGAMAPSGGLINRAVSRSVAGLENLNLDGPGWMYFGINPADRGLGYNGGYITLGGFIPYAEDDLGGFWAADLRGHLSEYGGFFSNVGAVRKQFIGGTLLGVGVYWDYDGDQNQYPTGGLPGTEQYGQFGHSYNQVGVSGEWLTDYGNLRSNGYIPVGSTAYTVGNPGVPFFQNYIMCQNGLDAALGGADLEVGAYVPALADWAGMISVGGYALGNTRYDWSSGPLAGQGVVPWFGGVYTRLDMTFLENWDFSIQYNNDSYFDSTGFIRLTYRMGGSRRRNVPDQVEQPMWRNEHIVRAHQTPVIVQNPNNGNASWNVIHVNNAAPAGGNGTYEAPFQTLAQADAAAVNPWDIVYVNEGLSTTSSSGLYGGTFSFNAQHQSLVGSGGSFAIASQPNCGVNGIYTLAAQTAANPVLSNPGGASVLISGTGGALVGGARVENLNITGSGTGILAEGNLSATDKTPTRVNNVTIAGDGTAAPQAGVVVDNATGAIRFTNTAIANMNRGGFVARGTTGARDAAIDFSGSITSNFANNGGVASPIIDISGRTGGTINIALGGAPAGSVVPNAVTDINGGGIVIEGNTGGTNNIGNVTLSGTSATGDTRTAIAVLNDRSTTNISQDSGTGIFKRSNGAAILVAGEAPKLNYQGAIDNGFPTAALASSYLLNVEGTLGSSNVTLQANPGAPFRDSANGILIHDTAGNVNLFGGMILSGATPTAIQIDGVASGNYVFDNVQITGATDAGVLIFGAPYIGSTTFNSLSATLSGPNARAFVASNTAAGGSVNIEGTTNLTTSGTAGVVINMSKITALDATINQVTASGLTTSGTAIIFDDTGGTLDLANFTVGGAPGTEATNISNTGAPTVTITLP